MKVNLPVIFGNWFGFNLSSRGVGVVGEKHKKKINNRGVRWWVCI